MGDGGPKGWASRSWLLVAETGRVLLWALTGRPNDHCWCRLANTQNILDERRWGPGDLTFLLCFLSLSAPRD